MRSINTPQDSCMACGYAVDVASSLSAPDITPGPGSLTICSNCGELMIFDENMLLRKLTLKELTDFQRSNAWRDAGRAMRLIKQRGKFK